MTTTAAMKTSPVWHPFTQMKTAAPPLKVVSGEGIRLRLDDGSELIDCISSWWVNVHGHCQPDIARAIYEQASTLEHVIFAGFTHEPAEQLARQLIELLGSHLTRIFFSDNGSTAVEVSLKMALQFWRNIGQPEKTKFIGFDGGYHGDTVGAMSVGGSSPFWNNFRSVLFDVMTVPYPSTFILDAQVEEKEARALARLSEVLQMSANQCAAVIIEPLVQGASGMKMVRSEFLAGVQRLCRNHNVLLIYDEVMTGFGRTGDWFAFKKSETQPDIISLSKGIAGGFLPLAVTACSERIYQSFLSDEPMDAFFHGHSFTANPISCAAALASLKLLHETKDSFMKMEELHQFWYQAWLSEIECVQQFRVAGTIAAFDVDSSQSTQYFNSLGPVLKQRFIDSGLLLRPLGNTVYLMPPYCIKGEELGAIYCKIANVLKSL